MKNIHLLPTDKPSRLRVGGNGNFVFGMIQTSIQSKNDDFANQHIYITSDEEIKEGDWVLTKLNEVILFGRSYNEKLYKKIILTTDPDLIKDGVQAIDDEFLEWFVKNPSCEEVETIYGLFNPMGRQVDPMNLGQNHSQCVWKYKIIIPQEESKQDYSKVHLIHCYQGEYEDTCKYGEDDCPAKPLEELKQKTLEEAAEKWVFETNGHKWSNNDDSAGDNYGSFIEGAKWQSERMYSEEGVLKILRQFNKDKPKLIFGVEEWFEQFKKK